MTAKKINISIFMVFTCLMTVFFGIYHISTAEGGRQEPKITTPNQWPYRRFSYAKAYLYNLENRLLGKHAIIKNNRLDKTVVGNGVLLSPKQAARVIHITNLDIAGLIQGLSKSYIPHHGIVFYNKNHLPAAYITLCFDCEAIRVYPEIKNSKKTGELPAKEIKRLLDLLEQYKQIIRETALPIFSTPFQYREYGRQTTENN